MKNKLIIITTVTAILAIFLYSAIDRIVLYALSKAFDLEVKYSGLRRSGIMQFDINGLTCLDREKGVGIYSEQAKIRPKLNKMVIDFDLSNVRFIMQNAGLPSPLDSVSRIVEAPFVGNLVYSRMSGSVKPLPNGIEITRFDAEGQDMKLMLRGSVLNDGSIRSEIVIFLSAGMTKNIPEELSAVLLSNEPGGWKSLSVNLSGDYRSPSIDVTGKLFRLSVKEVVEK